MRSTLSQFRGFIRRHRDIEAIEKEGFCLSKIPVRFAVALGVPHYYVGQLLYCPIWAESTYRDNQEDSTNLFKAFMRLKDPKEQLVVAGEMLLGDEWKELHPIIRAFINRTTAELNACREISQG